MNSVLEKPRTAGFSDAAKQSERFQFILLNKVKPNRDEALSELIQIWNDTQSDNWAGHESKAIKSSTIQLAEHVINSLPTDLRNPSVGIEPDGQITLEWYQDTNHLLSVSIDSDGYLHYAYLMGLSKGHAVVPYFYEFPEILAELIRKL